MREGEEGGGGGEGNIRLQENKSQQASSDVMSQIPVP